jgi:small subunit ribosomal protein S13
MAEEKNKTAKPEAKKEKPKEEKKKNFPIISKEDVGRIIRILQTDVPGNKNIYAGLTRIKGVSWAISNAVCIINKLDKTRKIDALTKEEIAKIEETIKTHKFPKFLLNRRNDYATGEDSHIFGSNLDLVEEMDIKRLKKIRSFRGLRHALGQPTRGQSTKAHFRTNRKKGVGIGQKKAPSTAPSSAKPAGGKK